MKATTIEWDGEKDLDDAGVTNADRAERAAECVRLYVSTKAERWDDAEGIDHATDLIADLLHYVAMMHFEAER